MGTRLATVQYNMVQVYAVCSLLNNIDILCVMPTGSGKTIVIFVFALCARKRNPKAIVVVGQPLSALIAEQHHNPLKVPVLSLSMGGQLRGSSLESPSPGGVVSKEVTIAEACCGAYAVFFGHPEAFDSKPGQEILRQMAREEIICAVVLDEVHQGLEGNKRRLN